MTTKDLDELFKKLLEGDNCFSESLKDFRKYKLLLSKYKKPKNLEVDEFSIELNFKIWEKINKELLAKYDLNQYTKLDEFFNKYIQYEVSLWDYEQIDKIQKETYDLNSGIMQVMSDLRNLINKTNWLYRNIK